MLQAELLSFAYEWAKKLVDPGLRAYELVTLLVIIKLIMVVMLFCRMISLTN